ncbi:PaaI family thioesterase, partial [Rhizobium johnstonii]
AAMETSGAELTRVEHGVVEIELPFDVKLTQHHGILHAGIISAALDSAFGFAAYSVIDPEASSATTNGCARRCCCRIPNAGN